MDHWQYLDKLLGHAPRHAELLLRRPCLAPLPGVEVFTGLLAVSAEKNMTALLAGHLLSCLAENEGTAGCAAAALEGLLASVLPGRILPAVEHTSWLVLPLPVIQGDTGRLVYLLAGLLPEGKAVYVSGKLSSESLSRAEHTLALFAAMHPGFAGSLVLIPLLKKDSPSITGGSLGLPLALALHLLRAGKRWPEGFYASGCLDPRGKILGVTGLVEKCGVMHMHSPRCFFLADRDAARYSGPAHVTPVTTLAQAIEELEFILLEEDPAKAAALKVYLNTPRHFLTHFNEIPTALLRHEKCRHLLETIKNNPSEFLPLVTAALQGSTFDAVRAALLTGLYDDRLLSAIPAADDPTLETRMYEYSIVRIAHANHIGDTAPIETWTAVQHRLRSSVSAEDRLLAFNHQFIAERFNRFSFRDDIPEQISQLLEDEEKRNRISFRANRHLGAMYGTLCQNYGFRGPEYLPQLLDYQAKAAIAFDRKYLAESKRLDGYRFYGLLEAGSRDKAVKALNCYLDLPELAGLEEWLRVMESKLVPGAKGCLFTVSAILRGLADLDYPLTPGQLEKIHGLLYGTLPVFGRHPWQLMLFNLARLLTRGGQRPAVAVCLDKMAAVCQAGRETMQSMGLLAFSSLHVQGLAEKHHYRAAKQLLDKMRQSRYLDQAHFAPLYRPASLEERLRTVADGRKRFFPFTYR